EILAVARANDNVEGMGFALLHLGLTSFELGDDEGARAAWEEARAMFAEFGFPEHVGHALLGLAALEGREGSHTSAARLLGSADAALAEAGVSGTDVFRSHVAVQAEAEARRHLGEEAFAAAYEE